MDESEASPGRVWYVGTMCDQRPDRWEGLAFEHGLVHKKTANKLTSETAERSRHTERISTNWEETLIPGCEIRQLSLDEAVLRSEPKRELSVSSRKQRGLCETKSMSREPEMGGCNSLPMVLEARRGGVGPQKPDPSGGRVISTTEPRHGETRPLMANL